MQAQITTPEIAGDTATRRFIRIFLLLLVAAGIFLRVHNADFFYYNSDEAMIAGMSQGSDLTEVWNFSHDDPHPPLGNLLRHGWMQISDSPAFVRSFSLLLGTFLIPLYYRIGKCLGGRLAGLSCATLITFSYGGIIQSYVVRQYAVFMLFISLTFFFWLLWRAKRKPELLWCYILCGALAALSHFTAVFTVLCIGCGEALFLFCAKASGKTMAHWLLANIAIALFAIAIYEEWKPILIPLHSYFADPLAGTEHSLFVQVLLYPLTASSYILPSTFIAALVLAGEGWLLLARPAFLRSRPELLRQIALCFGAFAFGILLVVTYIYPFPGTRHSLWLLPFVVAPAGWLLAETCMTLMNGLARLRPYAAQVMAIGLFATGCLTYNQDQRFADGSEYSWQQEVWNDFGRYMATLGPRSLIITEKDDGIMLANLYPFIRNDAFTGRNMAKLATYRDTNILFNPYYPRNYSTDIFLATLTQANEKHLLDGKDRLVFLRMAWSESPLTDLMLCGALDKQVVTFPDFHEPLSRYNIERARAAVMLISTKTLLEDVLPQDGKAHACLNGQHDMVPNLKHATP